MGRTKAAEGGREGELGRRNDSGLSQPSGESVVKPVLNTRTNADRDWSPEPCTFTAPQNKDFPPLPSCFNFDSTLGVNSGHQGCINTSQTFTPKLLKVSKSK